MLKLIDWEEIGEGIYINFPVGVNEHYEIVVRYHEDGSPVETANADLYLVSNVDKHLNRELMRSDCPVKKLMRAAFDHYYKEHTF